MNVKFSRLLLSVNCLFYKQMASRSELTLFQRGEIIGAWKCGLSETRIAAILGRAPSTVHDAIVAYRDNQQE